MIRFEHLSIANITVLNEILATAALPRADLVRAAFLQRARNFDASLDLLKGLGCVAIRNGIVVISPQYRSLLISQTDREGDRVKRFLIEKLVFEDSRISFPVGEFLALFDGKRELIASKSIGRKHSGVRNFLIDLEFLQLDVSRRRYRIAPEYALGLSRQTHKCSPERLKAILADRDRIGLAAEIAVLEYEKERLASFPGLSNKIEHTAKSNTAAGFDILSFETPPGVGTICRERFIEVKAVSRMEISFYLTRNEMETAARLGKQYCLYLLPFAGNLRFDINGLQIIRNPTATVLANKSKWLKTVELVSFRANPEERAGSAIEKFPAS